MIRYSVSVPQAEAALKRGWFVKHGRHYRLSIDGAGRPRLFSAQTITRLIARGSAARDGDRIIGTAPMHEDYGKPLAPRQREFIRHLLTGASNKEIAHRMGIGETSAKALFKEVQHKLGGGSRLRVALVACGSLMALPAKDEVF